MPWYDAEGADLVRAQQTPAGIPFPDFTGSGSPEGVITAALGKSYVDETGAIWFKLREGETPPDSTGWGCLGSANNGSLSLVAPLSSGGIYIGDAEAVAGSGVGLYYNHFSADGEQEFRIFLGPAAAYGWYFKADGTTDFPSQVTIRGGYSTLYADGSAQFQGVTSTGDITVTYPHGALIQGTGTFGAVESLGDITVANTGVGLVLQAPNASRYRLKVANDGTLSTELVV